MAVSLGIESPLSYSVFSAASAAAAYAILGATSPAPPLAPHAVRKLPTVATRLVVTGEPDESEQGLRRDRHRRRGGRCGRRAQARVRGPVGSAHRRSSGRRGVPLLGLQPQQNTAAPDRGVQPREVSSGVRSYFGPKDRRGRRLREARCDHRAPFGRRPKSIATASRGRGVSRLRTAERRTNSARGLRPGRYHRSRPDGTPCGRRGDRHSSQRAGGTRVSASARGPIGT